MLKKTTISFLALIVLVAPAFAINYAEVQKLAVQYDLHNAIPVFNGFLERGWHNYGSVTVPNWDHVYLVIVPYAESGHRITVKVNGYDVITNRPLSSTVTADITNYVNPGDTARIDIWCSGMPRVGIFLAPPNGNILHDNDTAIAMSGSISNPIATIQFVKYGLIGLFILMVAVLAVVLIRR